MTLPLNHEYTEQEWAEMEKECRAAFKEQMDTIERQCFVRFEEQKVFSGFDNIVVKGFSSFPGLKDLNKIC